ncbi:MAG: MAPEG family protein [Hyphomonadaceae bacterium]|nr:MAPEG family protein [Hyphomonadaceae bacterium]
MFIVLWLALAVRMVSRVRFVSAEDNRGAAYAAPSAQLAVKAAFLQNTLEQSVIAIGAHLTLATLIDGSALALIVGAVVLFVIGRAAFLFGYPNGAGARAFGMVVTALPSICAAIWALWLIGAGFAKDVFS